MRFINFSAFDMTFVESLMPVNDEACEGRHDFRYMSEFLDVKRQVGVSLFTCAKCYFTEVLEVRVDA